MGIAELLLNPEFILLEVPTTTDRKMKLVRPAENRRTRLEFENWYGYRRGTYLPHYALSHLWSIPDEEKDQHMWDEIGSFVNDENGEPVKPIRMRVEKRQTLLALLRAQPGFWWIDVLCARVDTPLVIMGDIYKYCQACYAMIDCPQHILVNLPGEQQQPKMKDGEELTDATIEKCTIHLSACVKEWSPKQLECMDQLTQCKWWNRVWTWQEATLPCFTYLICESGGDTCMNQLLPMEELTNLALKIELDDTEIVGGLQKHGIDTLKKIVTTLREIQAPRHNMLFIQASGSLSPDAFTEVVTAFGSSRRKCMDPADYVYGVLGMLELDIPRIDDHQKVWRRFLTELKNYLQRPLKNGDASKIASVSIAPKSYLVDLSKAKNMVDVYDGLLDVSFKEQENASFAIAELSQFLENRNRTNLFQGEPLRALTTLSFSDNVDLQWLAARAFAEITEKDVRQVGEEALNPILSLLQSHDIEVQRAAGDALKNLAVNTENELLFVKLGVLEYLVRQMENPNVEVQCNAVGCIMNLTVHDENKARIAKSDALRLLVDLACSKDSRIQRNATGALLNITKLEENGRHLVNAGAIPILIDLLRSQDVDVQYCCSSSLCNMAADAAIRETLAQSDSRLAQYLIALMETKSLKIQRQAACALANLALNEKYAQMIVHCKGLTTLLRLLNSPVLSLICLSVTCIHNVSTHPENATPIIDVGFVKPLIKMLSYIENEEIEKHTIATLSNLASRSESSRKVIIQAGAVERICMFIDRVPPIVQTQMIGVIANWAESDEATQRLLGTDTLHILMSFIESDNQDLQYNAAHTLFVLTTKSECSRTAIVQAGAVEHICNLMDRAPTAVQVSMTAAIANLALSDEATQRLLGTDILRVLVPFMESDNLDLQNQAARVLRNLASFSERSREDTVQASAVERICTLIDHVPPAMQISMTTVIGSLALSDGTEQRLMNTGILRVLMPFMESDNLDIQHQAVLVLRNLTSRSERSRKAIVQAGAVERICGLIDHAPPAVQVPMTATIANLALSDEATQRLLGTDILRVLVPFTESDSSDLQHQAALVLRNLASCSERSRTAIVQAGAVECICMLIDRVPPILQTHMTGVIANLALSDEATQRLLGTNILHVLVHFMESKKLHLQLEAARALGNLASCSERSRKAIVQAGAVERICTLIDHVLPAVQVSMTVAIACLARSDEAKQRLLGTDILRVLVSFMESDNLDLQHRAAGALGNLANRSKRSREAIIETGAVERSCNLMERVPPVVQVSMTAAIAGLARSDEAKQRLLGTDILRVLVSFMESNLDLQHQASLVLRTLASYSERSRTAIVQAGAVERISMLIDRVPPILQTHMTAAIANLALSDEATQRFPGTNVLHILVHFMESEKLNLQLEATRALGNLADRSEHSRKAIVQAGAVEGICNLIDHAHPAVQVSMAEAIANLALSDEAKQRLLDTDILHILAHLMISDNLELHYQATRALWNLG